MLSCNTCNQDFPESSFFKQTGTPRGYQYSCKVCTRENNRVTKANRDHKHRSFVHRYKSLKGCSSCGYNEHPAALQFDHIDPSTKCPSLRGQGRAFQVSWSLERIKDEIRKCRVLCANCHAIHSYTEGHQYINLDH